MTTKRTLLLQVSAITVALAISAPAFAQETSEIPSADQEVDVSNIIVVTARKREESLQDVPIAITAITGDSLEQMGIDNVTELDSITPGLTISQNVGFVSYFLRGVGSSTTIPGVENAVATYVDGVYVARPTGALQQLQNIERVEVLRGPQGTLFGRNATGGLVNIITRQPSSEFEGSARVSYGNASTFEGSLYLTGPLAEGVSAAISVAGRKQSDGYGTNLRDGSDLYTTDYANVRAQLKFELSPSLNVLLSGHFLELDSTVPGSGSIARGARPATANGGTLTDGTIVGPARFTTNPRQNYSNNEPIYRLRDYGASLTLTQDWENVSLTAITAWNRSVGYIATDFDLTDAAGWSQAFNPQGVPTANPTSAFSVTYEFPYFVSQELRLTSTDDGPFQWQIGIYGQGNKDAYNPILTFNNSTTVPSWGDRGELAVPGFDRAIVGQVRNRAYAAFAQATYTLAERFDLTAGIRYNYEKKNFLGQVHVINPQGTAATLAIERTAEASWERPTWHLNAAYHVNDDAMVYASYNRGFRSGVFNTSSPTSTTPINEEVIDAYELGFKTELLDGRMTLNGSAFYYDYQDLQFQLISPVNGTSILVNAAAAEIKGFDLELAVRPSDGVNFFANLSVIDSEYSEFPNFVGRIPQVDANGNPTGGAVNAPVNVEGNRLILTAPYSLSVGTSIQKPLGASDTMIEFATDVTAKGRTYLNPEQTIVQTPYITWNASIGLRIPSGKNDFSIGLWARNLTDKDVLVQGSTLFNTLRTNYNEPRTYGIRAGVKF
tara:strand:+ start:11272 stop:13608 length:2337 start_codon:yes stop_codon:yes gene_type:complete